MIKKIPSFIDLHVHFRDPGFNQKETILTGLKSAYFGGFGAVCTMPNTNPVCDNPKIAEYMINKAKSTGLEVELYPVSAITKNLDSDILVNFDEMKNAGAIAFSNDGLPVLNKDILIKALKTGEIIMSHLENETTEAKWQIEILDEVTNMAKRGECNFPRLHFCHISKKETIELIKLAKQKGLNLTAETAPHYFTFTKENLDNTGRFKMNPPLGSKEDKSAVIKAVIDGTIDIISTDHAPHTNEEKLKPYTASPNGITGLETAFSLSYQTFGLDLALEKMAYAPRKLLNINPKREITVDLDEKWTAKGENFNSKCKITPYQDMELKGKILC